MNLGMGDKRNRKWKEREIGRKGIGKQREEEEI